VTSPASAVYAPVQLLVDCRARFCRDIDEDACTRSPELVVVRDVEIIRPAVVSVGIDACGGQRKHITDTEARATADAPIQFSTACAMCRPLN